MPTLSYVSAYVVTAVFSTPHAFDDACHNRFRLIDALRQLSLIIRHDAMPRCQRCRFRHAAAFAAAAAFFAD